MKTLLPLFLLTAAFTASPSSGWYANQQRSGVVSTSALQAKVKKASSKNNKKKSGASSGKGGFGAAPAATTKKSSKVQDDYAAFPALDPGVKETLAPFVGDIMEAQDLPTEMYERLAQIYGFRNFNYLEETISDDESADDSSDKSSAMSFEDLLSTGSAATEEDKTPSSDFSDLLKPSLGSDLNSLLATATGSEDIAADDDGPIDVAQDLPISKLPPFEKFKVLHVDPLVLSVEDFFTDDECDRYVSFSEAPPRNFDSPLQSRSKTVGKDSQAQSQRTSTTWYHHYKGVPELMAKAARLFGVDRIDQFEEPQTVRYRRSEKFTWHLDALAPGGDPIAKAGQRTATLLVYLTDLAVEEGGATMFRDLGGADGPLKVQPKKGSALVFFPAAAGILKAPLDIRTLHCGEAVAEDSTSDKWIAQLWLREKSYKPTAPPGNAHSKASEAVEKYCNK